MIRHVVAFRFRPDAPSDRVDALLAELETFPGHFPSMQRWSLGTNRSNRDDTFTHAFSVEFATEADLLGYLHSDRHERFVAERWRPIVDKRAIVSWEC